jgi:hypothetical protein
LFLSYSNHRSSTGSRNSPTESGNVNVVGNVPATVTGDALKLVPINHQASINIELPNASDLNDVTVTVTSTYRKLFLKYKFSIYDAVSVFMCKLHSS